jgi:hypothetical protein
MYTDTLYTVHILHRSICPLVVQSYTIYDEAVSPTTPRKYIILNRNLEFNLHDFDLHDVFQEHNPGIKQELLVHHFEEGCINFPKI